MTSKERKALRGFANRLQPIFQIGKGVVNENLLIDLSDALDARELIKVSVLNTQEKSVKELLNEITSLLKAEPIAAIGNKFVMYRYSKRNDIKHIEYKE